MDMIMKVTEKKSNQITMQSASFSIYHITKKNGHKCGLFADIPAWSLVASTTHHKQVPSWS